MIPEPLIFIADEDGIPQFISEWSLPSRTIIDVSNLLFRGWIVVDDSAVRIMIGEKTVVYERVGYGIHGEWICDLRWTPTAQANDQDIAS